MHDADHQPVTPEPQAESQEHRDQGQGDKNGRADRGHGDHDPGDHDAGDHGNGDHEHEHASGPFAWLKELYQPHSHDAADSVDSALESSEKGIRAVKISLAGLLITALLQVIVVVVTGSVALLADTIHNFSDGLTSIPLWIAFVIGRRAATTSFTYGFRRAEDLSGLFIVAMIAFSAAVAGWESVRRILEPTEVTNIGLLVAAGVIGFLGNEAVALYRIRIGNQIGSAALIADGHHARTDGLTSLAVVFGGVGVWLGFPLADPIIGLLITVAILFVLRDALRQVFRRLMDGVDPAITEQVDRLAGSVTGVLRTDEVRVRWLGHRLEASLHIQVDGSMSVADGHDVAETVRHDLFHGVDKLDEVTIHVDPSGSDHHDMTRHHADRRAGTADPGGTGGHP